MSKNTAVHPKPLYNVLLWGGSILKETLRECATLAELLTTPQDLCKLLLHGTH
jgi:hypothetical protein